MFRLTSTEIRQYLEESDDDNDDELFINIQDDPALASIDQNILDEESDAEPELLVESYDSDTDSDDSDAVPEEVVQMVSKDGITWQENPLSASQTPRRNILRQKQGTARFTKCLTAKETFKSIFSNEMCDIILRESNRKLKKIETDYQEKFAEKYPDVNSRPVVKTSFDPFTEEELDAFLGILIVSGLHRLNKEPASEMWKKESLPIIRCAMSRNRFLQFLRCIRFDNDNTRASRLLQDKAAPITDIWLMLNHNLKKCYIPGECLTVDEQLFGFRGRTKFTQYIPSKPAKYGIKVFWICDAANGYPLHGDLYKGKLLNEPRQSNIGEKTVLELVAPYKNSGRNITCDNFFTSLSLAKVLTSWGLSLVGTVRKNKRFLPACMMPSKNRPEHSTNFGFNKDATICSYVPKKGKAVVLLSTMHFTPTVDDTATRKPEIVLYYNSTKGGVDVMDKMLNEYTTKRSTRRWPLAFFFNILDVAALAAFIIFKTNNPTLKDVQKRRSFLNDLAFQLCNPAMKSRSENARITKDYLLRISFEMVLGCQLQQQVVPQSSAEPPRDQTGRIKVVGQCYKCKLESSLRRKTRKSCCCCDKPICDEHSSSKTFCNECFTQNSN